MKKNVIRLTENQLHQVIKESVQKIVEDYRSGSVSNDGNHMVGGKWWNNTSTVSAQVSGDDIANHISEVLDLDEETYDALYSVLADEMFNITCESESGADESVGIGEYSDLTDFTNLDGLDEMLASVLGEEDMKQALDAVFEMLQNGDYNWN